MSQNPLTLTRQTLYDLVWSKPMSDLAKEFNISDVGLAKRCRAVDVPIPYRGYWARKAAGQEPPKLPLLVETQIPKILFSFRELAVRLKAERLEAEREQRLREEEERGEQDRQERREAQAKLIADLERQAGAWYRARFLRRYVHAARRAVGGNRIEAKFRDQSIDFLDWAAAYVDQFDPLSETARSPDQLPEPTHYYRSDKEALKKTLLRIFGFDGRTASKLTHQSKANGLEDEDEEDEDFEDE
jgi:hypothetical protein